MQTIEAGIVTKIWNALKKMSQALFNVFDKLVDAGIKVDKQEELEDGTIHLVLKGSGKTADVEVPPAKNGKCDVIVKVSGQQPIEMKGLAENQVEKEVLTYLKEYFGLELEPVKNSKRLGVTLQKVETAEGFDIKLRRITANFSPVDALAMLDTCVADDSFCNAVTEAPVSFMIIDDDEDDLDVDTCEESAVLAINPYVELAKEAQRLILKLEMTSLRFNKATSVDERNAIDAIIYNVSDIKRLFMNRSYQEYNTIPDLCACCCDKCDGYEEGLTADISHVCAWAENFYDLCLTYSEGFDDGVFITELFTHLSYLHDAILYNSNSKELVSPTVI